MKHRVSYDQSNLNQRTTYLDRQRDEQGLRGHIAAWAGPVLAEPSTHDAGAGPLATEAARHVANRTLAADTVAAVAVVACTWTEPCKAGELGPVVDRPVEQAETLVARPEQTSHVHAAFEDVAIVVAAAVVAVDFCHEVAGMDVELVAVVVPAVVAAPVAHKIFQYGQRPHILCKLELLLSGRTDIDALALARRSMVELLADATHGTAAQQGTHAGAHQQTACAISLYSRVLAVSDIASRRQALFHQTTRSYVAYAIPWQTQEPGSPGAYCTYLSACMRFLNHAGCSEQRQDEQNNP